MTDIEKIQSIIDNASDKFSSKLSVTEKGLLNEVLTLTQQLNVSNGRIASTVENLKLVNKIKAKLNQVVLNKDYLKDVSNLVKSFDDISSAQMQYFSSLTDKLPATDKYKLMQSMAIDNTITSLTKAGIESNVTGKLSDMLLKSVTSGGMYSDLVGSMTEFLTETEKSPGALTRFAQTYANTTLNQFAGQNNKLITDDLGLEWFQYVGSNKETTREFCEELSKKEYVHVSEIPEIVKGHIGGHACEIYERTGLPYGMIDGTDQYNFQVYCGGWNCGHKLNPISKAAVPLNVRSKFEDMTIEHVIKSIENVNSEKGVINTDRFGDVLINKTSINKTRNANNGSYKNQVDALHEIQNAKKYLNEYKGDIKIEPIKDPNKAKSKNNIAGYTTFTTKDGKYEISLEVDKSIKENYKLYYMKKLGNF
jgi:hypothetical protein